MKTMNVENEITVSLEDISWLNGRFFIDPTISRTEEIEEMKERIKNKVDNKSKENSVFFNNMYGKFGTK